MHPLFFRKWMRGYYDLVRTRKSSLFIFGGWNTVLVTTLMVRSMYLDLVEDGTGVLEFDATFIVKTILCTANLSVCQWEISQSSSFIATWKTGWSPHSRPHHTWRKFCSCPAFTSRSFFKKVRNISAVSWDSFHFCTMHLSPSQLTFTLCIFHLQLHPLHSTKLPFAC